MVKMLKKGWFFPILVHIWATCCEFQSDWWKRWNNWHCAEDRHPVSQWVSGLGDQSRAQAAGKKLNEKWEGRVVHICLFLVNPKSVENCWNFKFFLLSVSTDSFFIFSIELCWKTHGFIVLKDFAQEKCSLAQEGYVEKIKITLMSTPIL